MLQAFGTPLSEVENEPVVLGVVGEFCNLLAGGVKNELVTLGYADLIVSPPSKYKNAVPEGVPFDYGLFRKQEISVKPWRQKCVVVEVCMGNVPQKAKE